MKSRQILRSITSAPPTLLIAALTAALVAMTWSAPVAGETNGVGSKKIVGKEHEVTENVVANKSVVDSQIPSADRVPKNKNLKKIYDALIEFRSDEALRQLAPLINAKAKSGLKQKSNRQALARLLSLAGQAFFVDENLYAGLNMFSIAHKLCPEDTVVMCYLANGLRELPDFEAAAKFLSELERLPESEKTTLVYTTLARHYKRNGEYDKTMNLLKKAETLDVGKQDANLQGFLARTLILNGYGKPAVERFKMAADRTENRFMREIYLANAALVDLDESAQEAHLRAAGQIYPDDPIWRVKLAEFNFGHGREKAGFDLLQEALHCKRFSGSAYMKMARYLCLKKKFDQANAVIKGYQKRERQSAESLVMAGELCDAKGAPLEAEQQYARAIQVDPKYSAAYECLVKHSSCKSKDPKKALKISADFVKEVPMYWPAHFLYANSLLANDDLDGACEEAKKGLALLQKAANQLNLYSSHEAGHAHAIIGTKLYVDKEYDDAFEEAKTFNRMKFNPDLPAYLKIVVLRPGRLNFNDQLGLQDASARVALADMLLEANRVDDSIAEYRKALAIAPDDAEMRSYLMHVLSKKGDWGAAAKENFVFSQQIVNKIPATIEEWTKGKKKQEKTAGSN